MKKSYLVLTLALCFVLAMGIAGCGTTATTTTAVSETTTSVATTTTAAPVTATTAPATTTTVPVALGVWTNLNPAGDVPAARAGHSMVYDGKSGKVILFGGWDKTDFDDTWAYDPAANTWTKLKPAGNLPPARHDLAMAYEAGIGKVILFGG